MASNHLLRRHQLAHVSGAGWRRILQGTWDEASRTALAHWAAEAFPMVVTRQRAPRDRAPDPVMLGISLPRAWDRRQLSLRVPVADILMFDEFPDLSGVVPQLPRESRAAACELVRSLAGQSLRARVYGSFGWQAVTALRYVHDRSDLDLWVAVDGEEQADTAAAVLAHASLRSPRVDGELVFTDGSAVAWREWHAWRQGECRSILVKRIGEVALRDRLAEPSPHRGLACLV